MNWNWVEKLLTSTAVYWEPPSRDGLGGYSWSSPVQMDAWWEQSHNITYNATESQVLSKASAWVQYDKSTIVVGGYLWEGLASELPQPSYPPYDIAGAYQITYIELIESIVDSNIFLMRIILT